MKYIKEYNNYDFIGQQAALHGMSREEWVAHYATPTIGAGIDESKYVMTYEKYQKYSDFKKNWGSPSDIEDDLRIEITNMLAYGGISDNLKDLKYADQSTDKGIKWQINIVGQGTMSDDIIHAYKIGNYRGQYEWYLNKKKSSKYEIQQYLLNKHVSDLEKYMAAVKSFDYTYQYSDDSRKYKRGGEQSQALKDLYSNLSSSDKKKAHKEYVKRTKQDVDFKSFTGA